MPNGQMPQQPMSAPQPMPSQPVTMQSSAPQMPSSKTPNTGSGKRVGQIAGGLGIAALACFLFAAFGESLFGRGIQTVGRVVGVSALIFGIAAFATGLVALLKFKQKSFLVYYALVVGLLATGLTIAELFILE